MSNVTTFANNLIASDASNARTTLGLTLGENAGNILQAKEALIHGDFLKMDNSKVIGRTHTQTRDDLGLTLGSNVGNILPNGAALDNLDFLKVSGTGASATMIGRSAAETRGDLGITLGSDAGNILQIDDTGLTDGQLLKVDGGKMKGITIGSTAGSIPEIGTNLSNNLFLKVDSNGKLETVSNDVLGAQIGAVRIFSEELLLNNVIAGGTNVATLTVPSGYIATKIGYFVNIHATLTNSAARFSLKIGNDTQDDRYLTQRDITSSAVLGPLSSFFEQFHLDFPFVAEDTSGSELQLKNKINGNSAEPGFTFSNMTIAARVEGQKFKLSFINGSTSGTNSQIDSSTMGKLHVYLELMPMQQS